MAKGRPLAASARKTFSLVSADVYCGAREVLRWECAAYRGAARTTVRRRGAGKGLGAQADCPR